jgi:hypothetical protein
VAVSAPGLPGVEWPHYTFGPDEYGWVIQDDGNSAGQSLKVYAICADPPSGYEVVTSPFMSLSDTGFGSWSCPAGKVVIGGGFEGEDPVAVSAPGLPGVEWPHYTFGPDEHGWVIQDDGNSAGQSLKVYALCAEETVLAVPVAGTMALIGLGALLALVGMSIIGAWRLRAVT